MNSIRRRLTVGLLIGFSVLWAAGGTVLYLAIRAGLTAEFDDALKAAAEALTAMTTQEKGLIEVDFNGESMPGFGRRQLPDYFQMWRSDGTTAQRSPSLGNGELPSRLVSLVNDFQCWNLPLPDGCAGRAISIHFVPRMEEDAANQLSAPEVAGSVTLVVARHRAALDHRLRLVATTLFLVGGMLAAMTGVVVPVMVGRGLKPLNDLEKQVAMVDARSLQLRFPAAGLPAELQPICLRLNELLARLEASFERERRFSADVAHELRTPIAELRTLAEVALKWPDDPATARDALQDTLAVALQMESIATKLLELARCEGGLLPVHVEPVLLSPLVREICQSLSAVAESKHVTVFLDLPDEACWPSDPALLRAILTNLLSNAVQYCTVGGSIRLRAEHDRLLVSNTTDTLSPDDLPHLFTRFWRKDPARSSSVHCGLGLALAKAYAEALGMELRAEVTVPQEITFALSVNRA